MKKLIYLIILCVGIYYISVPLRIFFYNYTAERYVSKIFVDIAINNSEIIDFIYPDFKTTETPNNLIEINSKIALITKSKNSLKDAKCKLSIVEKIINNEQIFSVCYVFFEKTKLAFEVVLVQKKLDNKWYVLNIQQSD